MQTVEIIKSFNALRKNLKKDFTGLREIRIALAGDSSTQFLNQCLRAYAYDEGFNFTIFEADYNQVETQLLDTSSELYEFGPEYIIIFESTQKLEKLFYKNNSTDFALDFKQRIANICSTVGTKLKARVIYFNFAEYNDSVFGSFGNSTKASLIYQLRKLNNMLMDLAQQVQNFSVYDFNSLNAYFGKQFCFDPKIYYTSDMVLSIDVLPYVSKGLSDIILAYTGKFRKCLIADLDNTLWGGIIGDDGIENIQIGDLGIGKAFSDLQTWIKQLKERGIILAVCSKNNEETAKEPFEKHPDMVLRMDDIAMFVANWNNKADNIRYIQSGLNIGFDSMVFIDDNPAEREIVRNNLPQVMVPEMPEDPTLYLDYLKSLNLFETTSFSNEDRERTKLYKEEAGRVAAMKNFTNEDDFLINLEMSSEVRAFDKFNIPRVAQLSQRSNQFNLRTQRYSEQDVMDRNEINGFIPLSFTLKDKFGENGLIAVVVLKNEEDDWFVENWFMSCRVLKRSMENFTLNTMVQKVKEKGGKRIIGEYLPTSKNKMVAKHYEQLGFTEKNGQWVLDLNTYTDRKNFIKPC